LNNPMQKAVITAAKTSVSGHLVSGLAAAAIVIASGPATA
jgi:hypothetical protein